MKTPTKEMSWVEKISFGCGNMGLCLCTTMVTSFAMYFYSNVMGLSMAQISTIMLIGGIADAISDPLTGIFIDKTNTRWGKARPYLLIFAIPLAIACYAVFKVPDLSQEGRYIYALITYVLYTLAYTLICIPQNCLIPALTDNGKDRLDVNMFGTLGTNIGQFIPSGLGLTLVAILGGSSEESGFSRTIMLFSVLGVLLILADFKNTNERCNPPKEQKASLGDIIRSMKNLPWFLCTCVSLLVIASVVVRASQAVYFATYVLNNPDLASPLLSISSVIGIPVALVIPFLATKLGKRNLVLLGSIMGVIGNLGVYLFKQSSFMIMFWSVILSLGIGVINGIIYVMSAECIDYGEWKMGIRIQGFLMAFVGFAVKVANSICTMLLSLIMDWGGYDATATVQSDSAIRAIEFNYLGLPTILFALIIVCMLFYTLDKKYPAIREELEKRRAAAAAQQPQQ